MAQLSIGCSPMGFIVETEYSFCGRYQPWYVSRDDTLKTQRQARVYNALYKIDCKGE